MASLKLEEYLQEKKRIVDEALPSFLPDESSSPARLREAMNYSLMAGGKRMRPILAMAAAESLGGDCREVLPTACAIEFIHTYSLIHDDLPAMDDDDVRRGKPTCHRVFGEALAILAGDALLTRAFEILTTDGEMEKETRLAIITELAKASGTAGMIGGQAVDIESEGRKTDRATIEYIHSHKTAALIGASVRCGALLAGGPDEVLDALSEYGRNLGRAFQVVDDILDLEGDVSQMGKESGSDVRKSKATYPSVFGLDEARREAERFGVLARRALEKVPARNTVLVEMVDLILKRRS